MASLTLKELRFSIGTALVSILVAVGTLGKGRLFSTLIMALGATHRAMPPLQRVTGPRVIKAVTRNFQPTRGGVATSAVGTQSSGVGILVAVGAILMSHPCKAHRPVFFLRPMTLTTVHLKVLSGQWKNSGLVFKTRRGFPHRGIVTGRAVFLKLSLMNIFVTAGTLVFQAQKSASEFLVLASQWGRVGYEFGRVALTAFQFGVAVLELKPGHLMLEILLPIRPKNQIVVAPLMLHMAVDALAKIFTCVQTFPSLAHGDNFSMALQALFLHLPIAKLMAFGAPGQAFKFRMRLA